MSEDIVETKIRFDTLLREAKRDAMDAAQYESVAREFIKKIRSDCVRFDSGNLGYYARFRFEANKASSDFLLVEAQACFDRLYFRFLTCNDYLQSIRLEAGGKSYEKRAKKMDELIEHFGAINSTLSILETAVDMCQHYVSVIDRISNN